MSRLIKKHPLLTVLTLLMIAGLTVNLYAALTNTYDTSTPAGGDDPREADDRMREIKAAVQERMNDHNGEADEGDHYWPLTGTEVSNVDAGQHRMVTLKQTSANPSTLTSYATRTDLGWLFQKDVSGNGELFWEDEALNVLQMTTGGLFNLSLGAIWDGTFKTSTSDASDTKSVTLAAGGAGSATRGAYISIFGNQHVSYPGTLYLVPGWTDESDTDDDDDDGYADGRAVIDLGGGRVSNMAEPASDQDAATKAYVDDYTGFGAWTTGATHVINTEYTATSDGFVTAYVYGGGGGYDAEIRGETPTGTIRTASSLRDTSQKGGVCFPVRSGDTWKVTVTVIDGSTAGSSVTFLPMGHVTE